MSINFSDEVKETASNEWYIFKDCNKHGPLTVEQINNLLFKNQITKDHHIWNAKYNDWVTIKELDVFKSIGFEFSPMKKQPGFIEDKREPKAKSVDFTETSPKGFFSRLKNLIIK